MTVWDIKDVPVFRNLNPVQIHNLIRNARKVRYKKGAVIGRCDDKSKDILIIVQGCVKVLSKSGDIIGILREKDIFNEIGFVYALPYCTSFVTAEDTILVIMDKTLIENLSKTDSSLKTTLVKNILSSLKSKSESMEQGITPKIPA